MRSRDPRGSQAIGWAVALLALCLGPVVTARAADTGTKESSEAPAVPVPPDPPAPGHADIPAPPKRVQKLMTGVKRYDLDAGDRHKGDLYFMSESVRIAGTQEGDLTVFGREIEVLDDGRVTGDINAWVQSATLEGTLGDTVRIFCGDLTVRGRISGDLIAVCGEIIVEKDAVIDGDVDLKGADIDFRGKSTGSISATGGQVLLGGRVEGDATLKGDVVSVLDEASVGGDLDYTSRNEIQIDDDGVVGGTVTYNPEARKPPVSTGGFVKWFFFMATALLAGLGALAIFRRGAPMVVDGVRRDTLRSAGIGFITMIVVPVAAAISCILIITIPAAILVVLCWGLLVYLAQVPVAVWLGEWMLERFKRPAASPFIAILVGMPLLYVAFSIPVIGKLALLATLFVGFGSIVISLWAARQARRSGNLPPGGMPAAPMPPSPSPV